MKMTNLGNYTANYETNKLVNLTDSTKLELNTNNYDNQWSIVNYGTCKFHNSLGSNITIDNLKLLFNNNYTTYHIAYDIDMYIDLKANYVLKGFVFNLYYRASPTLTIYGSIDNKSYELIDSLVISGDSTITTLVEFYLDNNTKKYRYYRISFTSGSQSSWIGEIDFFIKSPDKYCFKFDNKYLNINDNEDIIEYNINDYSLFESDLTKLKLKKNFKKCNKIKIIKIKRG